MYPQLCLSFLTWLALQEIMREPVTAADGYTYERTAIQVRLLPQTPPGYILRYGSSKRWGGVSQSLTMAFHLYKSMPCHSEV
jgi:hypothetical protein